MQPFRMQSSRVQTPLQRPAEIPPAKSSSLFALVLLCMLLGVTIGWGWKIFFHLPTFMDHSMRPALVFTSLPKQSAKQSRDDGSSDQVSTGFDQAAVKLHTSSAIPSGLADSPHSQTLTPTIDPKLLAAHVDTGLRLQIPALNIDASIETVGVRADGYLDAPRLHQMDGVGWYQNGPRLGDVGSSVVDGYTSRPNGAPAIFNKLGYLHVGDVITIASPNGTRQHFHVLTIQAYLPDEAPNASIFGDVSGTYLNLVTCDGHWGPSSSPSQQQVVVHAVQD